MDDPREQVRVHFSRIASRYDAMKTRRSGYQRAVLETYAELCGDLSESSVLEVGCGTGNLLASLAPHRGMGVDLSAEMAAIAQAHHGGTGLEFREAEAETLDLGERFQWVLLSDVLEHMHDAAAGIRRAAAHVAPGGKLLLTWPNYLWAPILLLLEVLRLKMPEGPHCYVRPKAARRAAEGAGLRLVTEQTRTLLPVGLFPAPWVNRIFRRVPALRSLGLMRVQLYSNPAESAAAPPLPR